MAQANDSILVTPGSGATVATQLANSKEHQVVMLADPAGHLIGAQDAYVAFFPVTVGVAAARTNHWDLFNASGSGKIIRVWGIYPEIGMVSAVAGVGIAWELVRTTAVGTGGTGITPRPMDTSATALSGSVTARQKPSGGATAGVTLLGLQLHGEDANAGVVIARFFNILRWADDFGQALVLREGEGVRMDQVTSSAVGNWGWVVVFTQE
jgi:hypothetical protein